MPAHGAPSVETTRELVIEALRDVVLPGLAEVGVDPTAGFAWLELGQGA